VGTTAEGTGLTDIGATTKQPFGKVYVIKAVPVETPVKMPEAGPIVATAALLQLHSPPVESLLHVIVLPRQTEIAAGAIGAGEGFMVTNFIAEHPVGKTYKIIPWPADIPVTSILLAIIVPAKFVVKAHVPPVVESVKVTVSFTQKLSRPTISFGFGYIVAGTGTVM
jgi:hypothetical protein